MIHPYQWYSLIVLLLLSAVFSGAETALTALSKIRIKQLQAQLGRKGRILEKWLKHPQKLLITILIGNNLVNIAASSMATSLAIKIADQYGHPHSEAVGITTGAVTLIILIFGEIVPKTYAQTNAARIAPTALRFIYILSLILYPVVMVLKRISAGINRLFGGAKIQPFLLIEDLQAAVSAGQKEGLIKEQEKAMIEGVFEFADTHASEIMTPRTDIVAVELSTPIRESVSRIAKSGRSRIPVYKEKVDNIIGLLFAKDLLELCSTPEQDAATLADLMRPVQYVPKTVRLDNLLRTFKTTKSHLAVVVDEFGGTAGIVTFEDVLEEIVGEIEDEFDLEQEQIRKVSENTFIVDAKTDIEKVNRELGLALPEEGFESIGGVVTGLSGTVPQEGKELELDGVRITITSADQKRIKELQIKRSS